MSHYRADLRTAALTALSGHAYFGSFTKMSAWAQNIDARTLPVFGVATPREEKSLDTLDTSQRVITLVIVFKRRGGDNLDDLLDDDSVEAELVLMPALIGVIDATDLISTEARIDGDGDSRVGTLTMTFRATHWLVDPIT